MAHRLDEHYGKSEVPSRRNKFDFVIVGGGTAGSVIANRLSENPEFQVMVIEDGSLVGDDLNIKVPFNVFSLSDTRFDWNFTSTPQSGLNGRTVPYARGHVLGGSSCINAMFYTRGSSDDYDRFAQITGDSGWSWDSLQPYIQKNEKWTAPADQHDTTGQFNPSVHSTTGMTSVSLPGFPQEIDDMVIETTTQLGNEFPFNLDMNSGKPLGLAWLQSTIGNGARSSAAASYLGDEVTQRSNLHIVLGTRATRILPTQEGNGSHTSLRTVELLSSSGETTLITATKEVILSAGTIGTPTILLHSGIGDKIAFESLGMNSVINLPDVGKNLVDHPTMSVSWNTTSTNPFDGLVVNATLKAEQLNVWKDNRTGALTTLGINQVAFLRIPDNSDIFSQFPDPSAGKNSPHIELAIGVRTRNLLAVRNVDSKRLIQAAEGSVQINSSNPLAMPLIDPGLLSSAFDVKALVQSVKSAIRFFGAPAWDDFVLDIAGPIGSATTDEELEAIIRSSVFPSGHIVGTAAMSATDADHGVVDPDLKLKHASGLRIVDASIMPFVIAGHTQAPVYIIAERAADLIKGDWGSPALS
ncbi:hypothetical protein AGABI1DRAFT_121979 [Agaricus bisporus var. burnettii JB137-S8]|uniref:pyranose dehydrogenase (acceptor) n=1 Tax=Agaricus bisporus var. burnettii (strain JB137-S8 / ATCC MYA-4627 / FGSC 10392) TaxID=597362 RepID=K5X3X7_AGABU|nr:uncharacterized protein AGABI1DRAFT_121979 [Agaricus bisporus var. burnettii JB137-S8]EKM77597.1 hypothetical protein AGABI1DRAFT_121979 [Agaricus bisporus var. burnettii JB137-S8]